MRKSSSNKKRKPLLTNQRHRTAPIKTVCGGCGGDVTESDISHCPWCGGDKCPQCNMGDDVECNNCPPETFGG